MEVCEGRGFDDIHKLYLLFYSLFFVAGYLSKMRSVSTKRILKNKRHENFVGSLRFPISTEIIEFQKHVSKFWFNLRYLYLQNSEGTESSYVYLSKLPRKSVFFSNLMTIAIFKDVLLALLHDFILDLSSDYFKKSILNSNSRVPAFKHESVDITA